MAILGIDLGTTNSLACVYKNNESVLIPNNMGEYLTPSVVSVDDDGTIIVGQLAKERLITHPKRTIANFKRYMGTDKTFNLNNKSYSATDLSSFVLRKLIDDAKEFLKEEIEEIVVSVPAYFSDEQRWATKIAGKLAGVHIERIINEPSAAALTLHQNSLEDRLYMVIDFGGGTLDVSIVDAFENIIEIIAVSGDNELGGEDFNHAIVKHFFMEHQLSAKNLSDKEMEMVLKEAEKAKRILSEEDSATIQVNINGEIKTTNLTYMQLFDICRSVLVRIETPIKKVLRDASAKVDAINDVVLVGGSCKMRIVKEYLEFILRRNVEVEVNPDYAIAIGCGIVAGIKQRSESIKDVLLSDICPFTLGTEVSDGSFSPIIERNSILPCSRENIYQTTRLGQTEIEGHIYQGENRVAKHNIEIGIWSIDVPANNKNYEQIKLRYTYDINGILEVEAMSLTTGRIEKQLILSKNNHMNEEEVEARLLELQELKMHPREDEKNKYLLEKADRIYLELIGEKRNILSYWASEFVNALETQDTRIIKKAYKLFEEQLDSITVSTLDISQERDTFLS